MCCLSAAIPFAIVRFVYIIVTSFCSYSRIDFIAIFKFQKYFLKAMYVI